MDTVKGLLIDNLKMVLKFALFAMITFLSLGFISVYIIINVLHTDLEISSAIAGTIIAIIIVIVDVKKFRFTANNR